MAKVINIIGYGSNVGKTYIMEGLIKELKSRGLSIATIKHDIHGFDIDFASIYIGKDIYLDETEKRIKVNKDKITTNNIFINFFIILSPLLL